MTRTDTISITFAIAIMITAMCTTLAFFVPIDVRAALSIMLVVHVGLYAWGTR